MGKKLIATLAGLVMMAGCGVTQPLGQPANAPGQTAATISVQHRGSGSRMMAGLDLSAKQKAVIRSIIRQQRAAKCAAGADANTEVLKAAFLAPEIDSVALTSAIQDKLSARGERIDRRVAMLTQIRDILTPEQRDKFAARKADEPKRSSYHYGQGRHGKAHMERMAKLLKLTDTQRDAFKAVHDAFVADKAAKREATASFMQTGDASALRTALMAIKMEFPIDAMVAAVATLDLSQRQKLSDLMEKHKAKMCERLSPKPKPRATGDDEETSPSGSMMDEPETSEAPMTTAQSGADDAAGDVEAESDAAESDAADDAAMDD